MENLRKRIAELEAKAVEAALIADLATEPAARVRYTRLAQELAQAIEGLNPQAPDRQFLLLQAEKCRSLAAETTGAMHTDLLGLACEFEMKAKQA